jgi:cbb3-type cytochrome oxidase subunit 3
MPGFAFWGLFLVFGLILVAYLIWMWWVERGEADE